MLPRRRILARCCSWRRDSRRDNRRLSWEERANAIYHRDRHLDRAVRCESAANIVRKVMAVLESRDASIMSLEDLSRSKAKRRKKEIIREVAARFPLVFKFRRDDDGEFWVELTPAAEEILRQEHAAIAQHDDMESLAKLKKLLMMARDHRIGMEKLGHLKHDLFLPEDFKRRLIPQHPESFRIVPATTTTTPKSLGYVELVGWEPGLAVTARELLAPVQAPHAFQVDARGQQLDHPRVQRFQELPFFSPYEDPGRIEWKSLEAEKRALAVLHELLSLMPMKKAVVGRLNLIQKELQLPAKYLHLVGLYPWIFYVSKVIPENNTIFLREGFDRSRLRVPNRLSAARDDLLRLMETVYERELGGPPRTVTLEIADEDKEDIDDFFVGFLGNLRDL
ncbi:protein WHAT'S THIS FACTOR 1-like [Selaginella moellendorffii]|uniref:protein WHAT'S THIS FACTOR 1-like n=1 Tax=Selaginella moellendorffii TaxID=88036 RepID=UPI000D1C7520|nr:protein WHAT'S THIS FACTOR 1-like [Selaginella moellendorffii]|eukprot:XP_024533851.1 protein WHAT'S THIS FACTOR 1-like [Selaginella moellendorffii]